MSKKEFFSGVIVEFSKEDYLNGKPLPTDENRNYDDVVCFEKNNNRLNVRKKRKNKKEWYIKVEKLDRLLKKEAKNSKDFLKKIQKTDSKKLIRMVRATEFYKKLKLIA